VLECGRSSKNSMQISRLREGSLPSFFLSHFGALGWSRALVVAVFHTISILMTGMRAFSVASRAEFVVRCFDARIWIDWLVSVG